MKQILAFLLPIVIGSFALICSHNFIPKDTHLLDPVNKIRIENGLKPVKYNVKLARSSYAKACDMNEKRYIVHTSPYDGRLWEWIKEAGYRYIYAGENLGQGCHNNDCTSLWMNSPKHKEIILDPRYRDGAVSECGDSVVLHFGLQPTPIQWVRMAVFKFKTWLYEPES